MILAFQAATTRRETSLTEAVYRQVTALSMVASKSVSRPAVVVQPGKGAFCGPTSRQRHKSHGRQPASTPGRHQDGCRQFWSYRLPDPDHRHVLAAAVTAAADNQHAPDWLRSAPIEGSSSQERSIGDPGAPSPHVAGQTLTSLPLLRWNNGALRHAAALSAAPPTDVV
jgi:hypothetical protein